MRHSTAAEWRFRYELQAQASPLVAPVPVNISTRSYECEWLDGMGSDLVLATATIDMSQASAASGGAVTAIVDEAVVQTLGVRDVWYYLKENRDGELSVIVAGWIVLEDDT